MAHSACRSTRRRARCRAGVRHRDGVRTGRPFHATAIPIRRRSRSMPSIDPTRAASPPACSASRRKDRSTSVLATAHSSTRPSCRSTKAIGSARSRPSFRRGRGVLHDEVRADAGPVRGLPQRALQRRDVLPGHPRRARLSSSRGTIRLDGNAYVAGAPSRPANWISWDDGLAFADWAGLRPMTELEFTKAARGHGRSDRPRVSVGHGDGRAAAPRHGPGR